jgi:hypothetical protein
VTSEGLVALTEVVEPWLRVLAAIAFVALLIDWSRRGRHAAAQPAFDAPLPARTELAILALVVGIGTLVRTIAWDSDATPVFWFSETATLYVDRILREGRFSAAWLRSLGLVEVAEPHDSAFVLPVHAGLQTLLGPRFGVPLLSGAVFGSLAIPLAWALGRRVGSPAFGLAFAALVACSPIMLMWSRVNALCTASVPHVLLVMLVGWEAGRRRSVGLALLTGVLAWTSVYLYYAARLGIPLALLAIVAGSQRASSLRRGTLLAAVAVLGFVLAGWALRGHATTLPALWPTYGGYAGNKGERTLAEFVRQNLGLIVTEAWHTVVRCLGTRRTGWHSTARLPGVQHGGLWILPVALLGIVGLVSTVRHARRQWLWLVLAAAGLALPALSAMTARRILVLELAWCAFAAQGLFVVVDALGARAAPAIRRRLAALGVAVVASWSVFAVFVLSAALPAGTGQQIPFGDAGFGDGVTCRRCLDAAKGWSREMADGAFVVLFDNDVFRENRTSPGGLVAYGKIATLVAGTPDRFAEAYELMAGLDYEPPTPGRVFDRATTDFFTVLEARMARAAPERIVWHFERPTSWERWLAGRLVAAGGTAETFSTPLSPAPGLRVVTPWIRRAEALAVFRELAAGLAPNADSPCIALTPHDGFDTGTRVLLLAPDGPGTNAPPAWLATSFGTHHYKAFSFVAPLPIGAVVTPTSAGTATIELAGQQGDHVVYEVPSMRHQDLPRLASRPHGLNCAVQTGGEWWVLDPRTGAVVSAHPAASALPRGDWIGIATDPAGMVVLASGSQSVVVYDRQHRMEVARFPARVSPSVREQVDECTPLAVGADWVAIADLRTGVLSVYDRTGRDYGTRRLDHVVGPIPLGTIAGAGRYLAVGVGTAVRTFELRLDANCRRARADGARDG